MSATQEGMPFCTSADQVMSCHVYLFGSTKSCPWRIAIVYYIYNTEQWGGKADAQTSLQMRGKQSSIF